MILGKYIVRIALRRDNPAFPQYQIFSGSDLVGMQFSMPCLSDCEWHDRQRGVYARQDESKPNSSWQLRITYRRGRPTNAERARREATLLTEIPE